jgi:hypothetical protein
MRRAGTTASSHKLISSSYSISQWRDLGYDAKREAIGSYLFTPRAGLFPCSSEVVTVPVPNVSCPYCCGPLGRLDPKIGSVSGRILSTTRRGDIVTVALDPVPRGFVAVRCMSHCRAVFSIPLTSRRHQEEQRA